MKAHPGDLWRDARNNVEAEQAVLGAILVNNATMGLCQATCREPLLQTYPSQNL